MHELDRDKLPPLLKLKYGNAISDAIADLGRPEGIGNLFAGFQRAGRTSCGIKGFSNNARFCRAARSRAVSGEKYLYERATERH